MGENGGGGMGEKMLENGGGMEKNVETREKLEHQPADTQPIYGPRTTFSGM